jgi:site-specific DNA recombinase
VNLRCAVYARYSNDKQSPLSIDDQLRKCREQAEKEGWRILDDHVHTDEALSGVGSDQPGLTTLLEQALSPSHPFDVILLDDTSRLSRNMGETARIFERLNFAGVRIVAVSQGIDSQHEQADVMLTMHGLVDSLYVKELAKKTHRGLEGLALRGLCTGGRCFGYNNVHCEEGVRLEINEAEAEIVRRIFQMSASGFSLKTIAKTLNAENIPPARPRARKRYGTWCPTAIQGMLRRELYVGSIFWNRSRFIKAPGSNKRLRRARPKSEWKLVERPELRIISAELWQQVPERLAWVKRVHGTQHRAGLLNRAASSRYLLSGVLRCGVCGANLVIVTGRSRRGYPKYGCPQNFNRGACSNNLQERQEWLEERLLSDLQNAVLQPQAIDYAVQEFGGQLSRSLADLSTELGRMSERKRQLETELQRLLAAVAESGHSPVLLSAIASREAEIKEINEKLLSAQPGSLDTELTNIRRFVSEKLLDLRRLLYVDVAVARVELGRYVADVQMTPAEKNGDRYYVAAGEFNLLGGYPEMGRARHLPGVRARMVAGDRSALIVPFRCELREAA